MNLALEEIVANIISYGFEDEQDADIRVGLCLAQGELRAEVQDNGKAFNPLEMPPPDTEQPLEQRSVGGLGLHLVRTLDGRSGLHQRQDNRNILALKKKVRES